MISIDKNNILYLNKQKELLIESEKYNKTASTSDAISKIDSTVKEINEGLKKLSNLRNSLLSDEAYMRSIDEVISKIDKLNYVEPDITNVNSLRQWSLQSANRNDAYESVKKALSLRDVKKKMVYCDIGEINKKAKEINSLLSQDEQRTNKYNDISFGNAKSHEANNKYREGEVIGDVWSINILGQNDKTERTKYPTQKPKELIRRFVLASTTSPSFVEAKTKRLISSFGFWVGYLVLSVLSF